MNTTTATTRTASKTTRAAIETENRRQAERSFGKYAQRYVTSLESIPAKGCCVEYFSGAGSNCLIYAAEYVAAVRAGGQYKSVTLYDRVAGRQVTAGDVRQVREACGL